MDPNLSPLVFNGQPVHMSKDVLERDQPWPEAVTLVTQVDRKPSQPEQVNDTGPMLVFQSLEHMKAWAQEVLAVVFDTPYCSCGHPNEPEIPRGRIGHCPVHDSAEG
jgi:hypothetical protein